MGAARSSVLQRLHRALLSADWTEILCVFVFLSVNGKNLHTKSQILGSALFNGQTSIE